MKQDKQDKPLQKHYFEVPPDTNGGESVSIETKFFSNGDPMPDGLIIKQVITLSSYSNRVSFFLEGNVLTPEILRDLADQLDRKIEQIEKRNNPP